MKQKSIPVPIKTLQNELLTLCNNRNRMELQSIVIEEARNNTMNMHATNELKQSYQLSYF